MTQLSNLCGASPVGKHIILFDGHDSHFYERALRQINFKNIQPFVLKSGDSINNQPNDNVTNAKLKSLYNVVKSAWMLKYGTTKFLPHYMNSVLNEAWYAFKVSSVKIIRDSFVKTNLLPLGHPDLTTNSQSCAAYIQISSGAKAE